MWRPPGVLACWSVTQSWSGLTNTRWSGRGTHPTQACTATLCISRAARAQKHKNGTCSETQETRWSAISLLSSTISTISTHQHTSAHINTHQHTSTHRQACAVRMRTCEGTRLTQENTFTFGRRSRCHNTQHIWFSLSGRSLVGARDPQWFCGPWRGVATCIRCEAMF